MLFLKAKSDTFKCRMKFFPAPGIGYDLMAFFLSNALCGLFPRCLFKIQSFLPWLDFWLTLSSDNIAIFQHDISGNAGLLPSLLMLDFRHQSMPGVLVKPLVRLNDFQRLGIHPVDRDMQMHIPGIPVHAKDDLMALQSHFLKKDVNASLYLLRRRLFIFLPGHDPVRDRHFAADGLFSQ